MASQRNDGGQVYRAAEVFARGNGNRGGTTGDGDPPHNDHMEARVTKLEEFAQEARDRLARIETKLDQTVTKADLSEAMNGMVKWVVGTAVGLGVAAITVMTFVLNNAAPKVSAPSAQPPIIIQIPSQPGAASGPGSTITGK